MDRHPDVVIFVTVVFGTDFLLSFDIFACLCSHFATEVTASLYVGCVLFVSHLVSLSFFFIASG